jgi:suppressor of fused
MREDLDQLGVWGSILAAIEARTAFRPHSAVRQGDPRGIQWPVESLLFAASEREWLLLTLGFSAPGGVRSQPDDIRREIEEIHRNAGDRFPRYGEFEFTLRVPRAPDETQPPDWAIEALLHLAATAKTKRDAPPLASLAWAQPSSDRVAFRFASWLLVPDVALARVETPVSPVGIVQAVGLFHDETEACADWSPGGFAGVLLRAHPVGATDPARTTLLAGATGREIRAAIERDGSAMGLDLCARLNLAPIPGRGGVRVELPVEAARTLRRFLLHRIPHGRTSTLACGHDQLVLRPSIAPQIELSADRRELVLGVTPGSARALVSRLRPEPGLLPWPEQGNIEIGFSVAVPTPSTPSTLRVGDGSVPVLDLSAARAPRSAAPAPQPRVELVPRIGPERRPEHPPRSRTAPRWCGRPFDHGATVTCVAVSDDGRRVATGGEDGTLRLWDAETGASVGSASAHAGRVDGVEFSADGALLLTYATNDNSAAVWNATDAGALGRVEWTVHEVDLPVPDPQGLRYGVMKPLTGGEIRWAGWPAEGRRVVVARALAGCEIWGWEPPSRASTVPETAHALHVALSPDGRGLATHDGNDIAMHDIAAGSVLWRAPCPHAFDAAPPRSAGLAFAGSGRLLVESLTYTPRDLALVLRALRTTDGAEAWTLDPGVSRFDATLVARGETLAVVTREEIRFVECETGEVRERVPRPAGGGTPDAISPDGRSIWFRAGERVVRESIA